MPGDWKDLLTNEERFVSVWECTHMFVFPVDWLYLCLCTNIFCSGRLMGGVGGGFGRGAGLLCEKSLPAKWYFNTAPLLSGNMAISIKCAWYASGVFFECVHV